MTGTTVRPLLAEELALLLVDLDGEAPTGPAERWRTWALGALLLLDLEALDRVTAAPTGLVVLDAARTDDDLLDAALDVAIAHPGGTDQLLVRLERELPGVVGHLYARLEDRGACRPGRRFGVRSGWRPDETAQGALLHELWSVRLPGDPDRGDPGNPPPERPVDPRRAHRPDRRLAALVSGLAESGQAGRATAPDLPRPEAVALIATCTDRSEATRSLRRIVRADAQAQGLTP